VVAVTEYRAGPGFALCDAMKERGLPYVETTNPTGNRDGIAVISRAPIRLRPCPAPLESQFRWLDIDLPEYGFSIGVLHIMAAGSSAKSPCTVAKTRFWDAVLHAAEARLPKPFLFVGDLEYRGARGGRSREVFRLRRAFRKAVHAGLD
jgi:exonuclease III